MSFNQSSKKALGISVFLISLTSVFSLTLSDSTNAVSTSGSVKLSAGVTAAISMTITGNADGTDCTNEGFDSCSTFGNLLPNQYASSSSLISVYTNSSDGYSLSVKADNHADMQTGSGNSIPAGVLSGETGGQGIWSYKTDNTGIKTNWTAMTTTDTTIKGTSIYSATDSNTTITYGLSTSNRQASGDYETTLIYTATAPNDTEVFEPNPSANFTGDNVTFSNTSIPITSGGTGTVTITPAEGYYLNSFTCTNGYTNNAITGSSATSAQTVTITNPNVAKSAVCTAVTVPIITFDQAFADAGKTKFNNYYKMQDISSNICSVVTSDQIGTLIDVRDNQQYNIFKAKDGNCWMGENLRYGINPDGSGHPFVAADTALSDNVNSTKMLDLTYDSTDPNTAGRIKNGDSGMKTADNSQNAFSQYGDNYTEPYINIYQANDVANYDGRTKYGVLYNYCAVSGGTICDNTAMSEDASGSVCPKGWKLPNITDSATGTDAITDGSVKTYDNLANSYGYDNTLAGMNGMFSSPINLLRAGYAGSGSLNDRSSTGGGRYWSSTKYTSTNNYANYLILRDGSDYYVRRTSYYRHFGFSARCVSKQSRRTQSLNLTAKMETYMNGSEQ